MLEGLLSGFIFYLISFLVALLAYSLYSPVYKKIVLIILISSIGHYCATYIYSGISSDSMFFYAQANSIYYQSGTAFVHNLAWYVREYITGDSYLSVLYFFSSFASLGGVIWYLLYLQLSKKLQISNPNSSFAAVAIMCWPSCWFFTSGVGKDSLSYLLIPLVLLLFNTIIFHRKYGPGVIVTLLASICLMTMIRPYLLMIMVFTYSLSMLQWKSQSSIIKLFWILILISLAIYVGIEVVEPELGGNEISLENIVDKSLHQKDLLGAGTYFTTSSNKWISLLMLPYSMVMNTLMPMFFFAHNITAWLASVENFCLMLFFYRFFLDRTYFNYLLMQSNLVRGCFYFFVVGMAFLSLINSNLGLSQRQKTMYVPAFLVTAMLVRSYKKNKQAVI